MLVLSLAMELWGTWLGNWAWRREVPWLGLVTDNPPLAAGAFYAALDLLVVSTVGAWRRQSPASPILTPSTRLAPGGDLQRALVLAVAPHDLQPERQAARAAPRGHRDRGQPRQRPERAEGGVAGVGEPLGRLARGRDRDDGVAAVVEPVQPAAVLVAAREILRVLLRRDALAAVQQLGRAARESCRRWRDSSEAKPRAAS